ncbi:MAG: hypothetical protein ACR2PT_12170 [Endozoicomonas sp.]
MSNETELPRVKADHKAQPVAGIQPNRSVQWDDQSRENPSEQAEANFRKSLQAALQSLMQRPELEGFSFRITDGEFEQWLLDIDDGQGRKVMTLSAEEVIRLSQSPSAEGVLVQFDC